MVWQITEVGKVKKEIPNMTKNESKSLKPETGLSLIMRGHIRPSGCN